MDTSKMNFTAILMTYIINKYEWTEQLGHYVYYKEHMKKPKKKILRKIIYEESTDDEVEEVVIDNRKKKPIEKPAKVKEVTKPVQLSAPKEPEVKSFNFFRY